MLLLGKLAGETAIAGAIEWIALRQQWLKNQLDWPRQFPSNATYTRALATCDAEERARVIASVLLKAQTSEQKEAPLEPLRQVAVDGKTLRGTLRRQYTHQPGVHVLSWYDPPPLKMYPTTRLRDHQSHACSG